MLTSNWLFYHLTSTVSTPCNYLTTCTLIVQAATASFHATRQSTVIICRGTLSSPVCGLPVRWRHILCRLTSMNHDGFLRDCVWRWEGEVPVLESKYSSPNNWLWHGNALLDGGRKPLRCVMLLFAHHWMWFPDLCCCHRVVSDCYR